LPGHRAAAINAQQQYTYYVLDNQLIEFASNNQRRVTPDSGTQALSEAALTQN
jgi:hypothetical protein